MKVTATLQQRYKQSKFASSSDLKLKMTKLFLKYESYYIDLIIILITRRIRILSVIKIIKKVSCNVHETFSFKLLMERFSNVWYYVGIFNLYYKFKMYILAGSIEI